MEDVAIFLLLHQDWLQTVAADIANDDTLVSAVELDVVEEVQSLATDHQTFLDVRKAVVIIMTCWNKTGRLK